MSDVADEVRRIMPSAHLESPGDFPARIDSWMVGESDYVDLSAEDQRNARLMFCKDGEVPIQQLLGSEYSVRFIPGDYFTGVSREWLIPRLALSPGFGRIHSSDGNPVPSLTCFLDGEEIDVDEECDDIPLGPGVDFWQFPLVSVGRTDFPNEDLVGATLYDGDAWLVSIWSEVHVDYLPVPTNELGEESTYRRTYEAWAWIVEMTLEWARMGAAHELPILSAILGDDDEVDPEEMITCVAEAAQGGLGVVTFNGALIYEPGATK